MFPLLLLFVLSARDEFLGRNDLGRDGGIHAPLLITLPFWDPHARFLSLGCGLLVVRKLSYQYLSPKPHCKGFFSGFSATPSASDCTSLVPSCYLFSCLHLLLIRSSCGCAARQHATRYQRPTAERRSSNYFHNVAQRSTHR